MKVTNLTDYEAPWMWIRHHWAPIWLTCGLCQDYLPDYVLKVETLEDDITEIFEHEFGMIGDDFAFPKVKTMGSKNVPNSKENSKRFLSKYFSKLSKNQIVELYQMYRIDFLLFNYSIDDFINWAT